VNPDYPHALAARRTKILPEASGSLVAFEGTEGAGKSTQIGLASAALQGEGFEIVTTSEPGGTRLGGAIRHLLLHQRDAIPTALAELFLYLADRAQHVSEVIRPALAAGRVVLTDRFSASTIAYQSYGRGLDLAAVTQADAWARQGVAPRLTILLDCPVHLGLQRARGDDRFHSEETPFHERVRHGFHTLAAADTTRWSIIDATQPAAAVHDQVMRTLRQHLPAS